MCYDYFQQIKQQQDIDPDNVQLLIGTLRTVGIALNAIDIISSISANNTVFPLDFVRKATLYYIQIIFMAF